MIDAPATPRRAVDGVHVLTRAGVSVAFAIPAGGLPAVVHWGAQIAESGTALADALARGVGPSGWDRPWQVTVLPTEPEGWAGRPGVAGQRDGRPLLPRWRECEIERDDAELEIRAHADGLMLHARWRLDDAGVLHVAHALENTGESALEIAQLEATMPVGDLAAETLDFSGRWIRERAPQRTDLRAGSRVRESRRGRTGHDAPFVTVAGTSGFAAARGEVWAVHSAWSGDVVHRIDALPEAETLIGAGPLLRAGEISLAPGERYDLPDTVFAWDDAGLDGISARLHRSLRARAQHPRTPRPVTLNTWEAVYFDHDLTPLQALARTAAGIGVERFVLDDGWFRGRRDDTAGLGDWQVDDAVWPHGLHPLAETVTALGMQFGLWVEPEMVNLDSTLAREHPDWLLQPAGAEDLPWRNQFVLDVSRPEVFEYLLTSLSDLVEEYPLAYLKWDQNRDIVEAVVDGRAGIQRHTRAVYRLIDELKASHPELEIESCASGGARIDLGILERTDRVWASDTNDPIERLGIQRWTELLVPLELIGAHVGPADAHTTRRTSGLDFRIATALFGSFGIEWDITGCTPEELAELATGIAAYRRLRPLLHSGTLSHPDLGDDGLHATCVVATDRTRACIRAARSTSGERSLPPRMRVPGLDPAARYRIEPVPELRVPKTADLQLPAWLDAGECELTGSELAAAGVRLPMLRPGQALVCEITRLD